MSVVLPSSVSVVGSDKLRIDGETWTGKYIASYGAGHIIQQSNGNLICTTCRTASWCLDRAQAISEGRDPAPLWEWVYESTIDKSVSDGKSVPIFVSLTLPFIPSAGWTPRIHLEPQQVFGRWVIQCSMDADQAKKFPGLQSTRIGFINEGEGRNVIRELYANHVAGPLFMLPECNSSAHRHVDRQRFEEAKKKFYSFLVHRQLTLANGGMCPSCRERLDSKLKSTIVGLEDAARP